MKFLKDYHRPADLPEIFPVFPLPGALLLPRADLPLNIFEPRYLEMISDALSGERIIGIIQPKDDSGEEARSHGVRNTDAVIEVRTLDVEAEPEDLLKQVDRLANELAKSAEITRAA